MEARRSEDRLAKEFPGVGAIGLIEFPAFSGAPPGNVPPRDPGMVEEPSQVYRTLTHGHP